MQSDVIEQVSFRARSPEADARMTEAAWAAQPAIERLPGFVSRHFGRSEDGEWIDLIRWRSMADARHAAEQSDALAGREPALAAFFGLIDMQSSRIRHFAAPAPASLWTRQPPPRRATLCLCVDDFTRLRAFYERHLNARALFEAEMYLVLQLGGPLAPELHLMKSCEGQQGFQGGSLMLNLELDDVDGLHARMAAAGVEMRMPLEDHPWGDRAFSCVDPAGLELYCYSPRPMAAEYAGGQREPWRIDVPAVEEIEETVPA
ncbi:VOC family protein [uncultured Aquimonas sp.]|uniref:VOC family protein n=1 Tax=uncultured Aquimonas sp. TaxID=385483 RepID=UPI00086925D6|nr:VOC family protein [uncultured Aquimonas sp.]ODU45335.1 MAG: hypothetical protein ABS96_14875 [Xanthomonadaceae bacterium SCN 69-123]